MTNDHPGLHLDNQLDAIANTWRPEVNALRVRIQELRAENEQLKAVIDNDAKGFFEAGLRLGQQSREIERLRARLDAAERLIEVVRSREIGTAGGVGAAFEAYDALCQTWE
jgi:hypothetical protein